MHRDRTTFRSAAELAEKSATSGRVPWAAPMRAQDFVEPPPIDPDRPAGSLRVLTYNVRRCLGLDGAYSTERIARVIARTGAEIVALQELDLGRARSGGVDQAAEIGAALGMDLFFHPAMTVLEERYGDAILSAPGVRLVKAAAISEGPARWSREPRGALWAEATIDGAAVQIVTTHFGLWRGERRAQAETMLGPEWLGHPDCRSPIVLLGDFNSVPTSRAYKRLAARLRDVQNARPQVDARTYPTRRPLLRIDHIFVSEEVEVRGLWAVRNPEARMASDHLPLCADLRVPTPG